MAERAGRLIRWNDERGFGFIAPSDGGIDIFVHITAFQPRSARPLVGDRLTFTVDRGPDGRTRASHVRPTGPLVSHHQRPRLEPSAPWGPLSLAAIPILLLVYAGMALVNPVPAWWPLIYLLMSTLTFFVYAYDKSAAVRGERRIRELSLLLLSFLCGWPGALIARKWLRHKSSKGSFRLAFRISVLLNIAGFILLNLALIR